MASRPPFRLAIPKIREHAAQIDCTKMLRGVLRPEVAWTAIDHAHSLNPTIGRHGKPIGLLEAQKRKARGVRPGVCDYLFWHNSLGYAIEFKVDDGELTGDEERFIKDLIKAKAEVKVCWGMWQVFETVSDWGLVRPGVRIAA